MKYKRNRRDILRLATWPGLLWIEEWESHNSRRDSLLMAVELADFNLWNTAKYSCDLHCFASDTCVPSGHASMDSLA